MGEEVVRGPAVHSKAEEARRALQAARQRRPSVPAPARTSEPIVPPASAARRPVDADRDVEVDEVDGPDIDARVRALVTENQALRSEVDDLRRALRAVRDAAGHALED